MRLLNFKAKNIFSLGEVELNLDKRGLLLVTGHSNDEGGANGSGKSSLSSKGLLWTLYGSTASGEKADAVINRFAEENAEVSGSVDVESRDGQCFRIIRSRRPNRLTVIDIATATDISHKTEKDTQGMVDALLGRSRDTFLQTDFFGQGKAAAFLDLTPKAQTELLETVLPFDQLNDLSDDTKAHLTKLKTVMASVERHIAETNGKVLETQRQERELSTSIDRWETERDNKVNTITSELNLELENNPTAAQLEVLKARATSLPTKAEIALQRATAMLNIGLYEDSRNQHITAIAQQKAAASKVLIEPKNATCPTCNTSLSTEKFDELLGVHIHASMERSAAAMTVDRLTHQLAEIDAWLKERHDQLLECEAASKAHYQLELDSAQLEATRNNDNLAILKQRLEAANLETNPFEHLYTSNASTLKLALSSLSHQKSRFDELLNDQKSLEFWQQAFNKELKNEFLNQVCPFLEQKANIHLGGMGNGQLKVKVSTKKLLKTGDDRSEFSIGICSNTGGSSYDALSGGERQMANFAVGLALSDLAEIQVDGPSYFMVLDEPFMALDARNSENLVNYLNTYLQSKKETILLVSNEESLKSLIPNSILVTKDNGVSCLTPS